MADVAVNVMIDGKGVFSAGAVGAPDGIAAVVGGLQMALRHFQDILAMRVPPPNVAQGQEIYSGQGQITQRGGAKPQDNSL